MLMSNETIVALYKEADENGDPIRQIKSLAKANGVKATVIKKILYDAGLEVPEKIPTGPMKKDESPIKAAVINEDFENEIQKMVKESKDKKGCLKDRTGSCEACDDTDNCFEYEKDSSKKAAEQKDNTIHYSPIVLPMPDAVKEALSEKLESI